MFTSLKRRSMLVTIPIIILVVFVIWLAVLYWLWPFITASGIQVDYFSMVAAMSTALGAAAVFGAGYVAYRELGEIADTRHMDVADKLFTELNSSENIEARRWIYQNLTGDPKTDQNARIGEGQEKIKRVLNSLDRVAFLTQSGWIPDEVVLPWMHPMIHKAWTKLQPYVDYEREHRKEPNYYEYAGRLAARCKQWREKNGLKAEVMWMGSDAL
jgi:hypothetical protein